MIRNGNNQHVYLTGDSMMVERVAVERRNDKFFFVDGWSRFVAKERISRGDMAVFAWVSADYLSMRLWPGWR